MESLAELELRRAELLGDLRWIEAQGETCESTEQHVHASRQSRQQERINEWEEKAAMAEVRIEMKLLDSTLEERTAVTHIRFAECRVYQDPGGSRCESDGHIARTKRCLECEFPHCEVCERQRSMSEGPVLVREKGTQADG